MLVILSKPFLIKQHDNLSHAQVPAKPSISAVTQEGKLVFSSVDWAQPSQVWVTQALRTGNGSLGSPVPAEMGGPSPSQWLLPEEVPGSARADVSRSPAEMAWNGPSSHTALPASFSSAPHSGGRTAAFPKGDVGEFVGQHSAGQ